MTRLWLTLGLSALALVFGSLLSGCSVQTGQPASAETARATGHVAAVASRQPLSVLLILDRSDPERFPQAVAVARAVLAELPAGSRFGVLAADDHSGQDDDVLLPPTQLGMNGRGLQLLREKKELNRALDLLKVEKHPALGTDLLSALRHAAWFFDREPQEMRRLILLPSDMRPDSSVRGDKRSYRKILEDGFAEAPFGFRNTAVRCLFVNRDTASDPDDQAWERITGLWIEFLKRTGLELEEAHFLQKAELETATGALERRRIQSLIHEVQTGTD